MAITAFLSELRRRKVARVAAVYGIVGWIIIQIADVVFPALALPGWSTRLTVILVLLGFPLALVLAWAFELTPGGIQRDHGNEAEKRPQFASRRPASLLAMGAGLAILLGAGFTFLLRPAFWYADSDANAVADASVAVLPFDNFGDSDEEYFSDGMTEDIIAQLTRIPDLTVVSRTSAMRYKDSELTLREIGRELGVGAILEGSVRRSQDRIRIVAQLIDARTDSHLWAETYDRKEEDVFALQSEVAAQIAGALGRTLQRGSDKAAEAMPPTDPETYDLYLRGRHLFYQRRPEAYERAIDYLREALDRDPEFALGYVALADALLIRPFYDAAASTAESATAARAPLRRALELDPRLGEAYTTLGFAHVVTWEWEEADAAFRRALELTPGYAQLHHWLGTFHAVMGRSAESVKHVERAMELDPLSARIHRDLAEMLLFDNRPREAAEWLERGMELGPNFADYHGSRARAYQHLGRERDAFDAAMLAIPELAGEIPAGDSLRAAFERDGYDGFVRAMADGFSPDPGGWFALAMYQASAGRVDAAVGSLERAVEYREPYVPWMGAVFPIEEPAFRTHPGFLELLEGVGARMP